MLSKWNFIEDNKTFLRRWNFTKDNKTLLRKWNFTLLKGVSLRIPESLVRNHKRDHKDSQAASTLPGIWKFHPIINTTEEFEVSLPATSSSSLMFIVYALFDVKQLFCMQKGVYYGNDNPHVTIM